MHLFFPPSNGHNKSYFAIKNYDDWWEWAQTSLHHFLYKDALKATASISTFVLLSIILHASLCQISAANFILVRMNLTNQYRSISPDSHTF